MKIPIPDDWDGETWQCYQIRWPASTLWSAILAGLISQPTRALTWDTDYLAESDGARATGGEILRRNWPWRNCAGLPQQPTVQEFMALGACYDLEGANEMPCLDLSGMLKIENGILYVKDSCCAWTAIGAVAGATEGIGDTPLDPTGGETPPTYFPCGKAKAVVDVIYKIVESAYAQIDETPWTWIPHVESLVGIDLDNKWVLSTVTACIILANEPLNLSLTEILDPYEKQQKLCELVALFSDDASGNIDEAAFQQVKGIMGTGNLVLRGVFHYAVDALGRSDMQNVAMLGATDSAANCDCPDQQLLQSYGPDGDGWYLSSPLQDGTFEDTEVAAGAVHVCFNDTPSHDVFGFAVRFAWQGVPGTIKMEDPSGIECHAAGFDLEVTETSSHHYETYPAGTWWVFAKTSALRTQIGALLGGQPWAGYNVTLFSDTPASPGVYVAGAQMEGAITGSGDAGGCTLTIAEVRWIHNTNSPN